MTLAIRLLDSLISMWHMVFVLEIIWLARTDKRAKRHGFLLTLDTLISWGHIFWLKIWLVCICFHSTAAPTWSKDMIDRLTDGYFSYCFHGSPDKMDGNSICVLNPQLSEEEVLSLDLRFKGGAHRRMRDTAWKYLLHSWDVRKLIISHI